MALKSLKRKITGNSFLIGIMCYLFFVYYVFIFIWYAKRTNGSFFIFCL